MNPEEYSLTKINLEIHEVNIYRVNLRKFLLKEAKNYTINSRKFQNILDELERIAIEINELENKKSEYLNLNNL
jgi:hypothetical protein